MKKKITPEEQALFREAVRNVKPLGQSKAKVQPEPPQIKKKRRLRDEDLETYPPAPFSDHEFLDPVDSETRLEFAHPDFSHRLLNELRRGVLGFEAILDLHGNTVDEAREALQQFIYHCREQGQTRILIIHGKGHNKAMPVLKNKLNHWLRQSEHVLAFCSAQKADGGSGALYVRLKSVSGKKRG